MRNPILKALFPRTRQAILSAVLLSPDKWWYLADLARHLRVSPSSLQRELSLLVNGGILKKRRDGGRVYYQADSACPVVSDLQRIFVKTSGVSDVVQDAIRPVLNQIRIAFIYGSVARAEELSRSDVDLMIIGDVRLSSLATGVQSAEEKLGREINPTIYSVEEFVRRCEDNDSFLATVIADAKIYLIGNDDELATLAR